MRHDEIKHNILLENVDNTSTITEFKQFLLFCKKELELDKLPEIKWCVDDDVGGNQPSFGAFHNGDQSIRLSIINRHPLDIMRTLAHELCHYKQYTQGKLNQHSGKTGSSEENEANSVAGVIMRKWNKSNPDMFNKKPIVKEAVIKLRGFGPDSSKPRATAWIQKVRAMFPKNPLDPRQIIVVYADDNLALVELEPCFEVRDAVHIKWMQATPMRQGTGSKAMKILQNLAKKDNITLTLHPMENGKVSQSDLIRFYSGLGFKPSKGNDLMIWTPDNINEGKLLDKKTPTVAELAKKNKCSNDVVEKKLAAGIKIEMEHTTKKSVAREIALDHLGEDINYYEKLAKIEKKK